METRALVVMRRRVSARAAITDHGVPTVWTVIIALTLGSVSHVLAKKNVQ